MRRFAFALLVALLALAGCSGGPTAPSEDVELIERWQAGDSAIEGNHHAAAAGRVGGNGSSGEAVVAVPIGGRSGRTGCKLLVLDGDGERRWADDVPKRACTIHAVADPTLADFTGDGRPELLAATTEEAVVAYDPLTGEVTFRHPLSDYGYTRPVVADVIGDSTPELVVTDIDGTLSVVRPDNTTVWRRPLNAFSWASPAVENFDASGGKEVVVGLGNGTVVAFTPRGGVAWSTAVEGSVTWTADGDVDDDPAREFLAATASGTVAALDGATGEVEWSRDLGTLAAVGPPVGTGADATVYATNRNGTLYALDGTTGDTEWTTTLTTGETQMNPPPVVGDVTGDGDPDVVAVTNDGRVLVVNPADGTVRGSYERDGAVFTHATLADTDGDGTEEIYVVYGDGTAVALAVQGSTSS
ncbi:PQQ-binding-like beta-propeller repeat protein [Halorarius halobius]|uniref:outer membrane protein assembly factor BamB family protein n=1 Tax=Halorarius halobius TaxID=2962671 RepID=UPI0020CD0C57|nr:PQQ-binding-like beta-propeller repeat protein [Halorarius halobius]